MAILTNSDSDSIDREELAKFVRELLKSQVNELQIRMEQEKYERANISIPEDMEGLWASAIFLAELLFLYFRHLRRNWRAYLNLEMHIQKLENFEIHNWKLPIIIINNWFECITYFFVLYLFIHDFNSKF